MAAETGRFRVNRFWAVVATLVVVYAVIKWGVPAVSREITGLPFVAEVLDPRDVDMVSAYADMIRIGTRNMSNHALLREVGRQSKPVQLKRGRAATVDEWISAAEYVMAEGNGQIVLVERGVRGFDNSARNTLDIAAVPVAKSLSHLPVMVDPSHAAGRKDLVGPLTRAAVAAGADGVLITSIQSYSELDPPSFAMSARLVSAESPSARLSSPPVPQ